MEHFAVLSDLPLVGAGLIFGTNAAPLLITELAYPTQVSYHDFVIAHLIQVESSVAKLLRCIIHCGTGEVLRVCDV
jgi:hypothetical protein